MIRWVREVWAASRRLMHAPQRLERRLERVALALGRIESRQLDLRPPTSFREAEFTVFSQWGEDGILDWLTRAVPIERRLFVEFGVEDYSEANTRFLLEGRGWSGLVMDSSADHISRIVRGHYYWRHNLKAMHAFVTAENVNALLRAAGIEGDIGLLSIDIDGNDYWVWEAITDVSPRIVVIEYNALFGPCAQVGVPYQPGFRRLREHHSGLYFGASLAALAHLGDARGYSLVGCDSAGCNAFFVRHDVQGLLPTRQPADAYVPAQLRQSRDRHGHLNHLPTEASLAAISDLDVVNVVTGQKCRISEVLPTAAQ